MRFRGVGSLILMAAALAVLAWLVEPFAVVGVAQSRREADGAQLLRGSLDLHVHMDPRTPGPLTANDRADLSTVRIARERGMRGFSSRTTTTRRRRSRIT